MVKHSRGYASYQQLGETYDKYKHWAMCRLITNNSKWTMHVEVYSYFSLWNCTWIWGCSEVESGSWSSITCAGRYSWHVLSVGASTNFCLNLGSVGELSRFLTGNTCTAYCLNLRSPSDGSILSTRTSWSDKTSETRSVKRHKENGHIVKAQVWCLFTKRDRNYHQIKLLIRQYFLVICQIWYGAIKHVPFSIERWTYSNRP